MGFFYVDGMETLTASAFTVIPAVFELAPVVLGRAGYLGSCRIYGSDLTVIKWLTVIFCVAGFRPGSRAPFVSAKGAKTIDAPSGLLPGDGRKREEGEPTRCAQTRLAES
jgi:hypothetical protein